MDEHKRLIDLDKIKPMDFPSVEMDGLDVVRYLETLPTVDAVPVMRCKDCKSYMAETQERCNALKVNPFGWCLRQRKLNEADYREIRNDDDFCSYGERRTNA